MRRQGKLVRTRPTVGEFNLDWFAASLAHCFDHFQHRVALARAQIIDVDLSFTVITILHDVT